MENKIKIFENEEFGKVRTVVKGGKPWLVGKDVAEILEYAVPSEGKLTVVSEAFLSSNMMDRQNFMRLMARFAENVKY